MTSEEALIAFQKRKKRYEQQTVFVKDYWDEVRSLRKDLMNSSVPNWDDYTVFSLTFKLRREFEYVKHPVSSYMHTSLQDSMVYSSLADQEVVGFVFELIEVWLQRVYAQVNMMSNEELKTLKHNTYDILRLIEIYRRKPLDFEVGFSESLVEKIEHVNSKVLTLGDHVGATGFISRLSRMFK